MGLVATDAYCALKRKGESMLGICLKVCEIPILRCLFDYSQTPSVGQSACFRQCAASTASSSIIAL